MHNNLLTSLIDCLLYIVIDDVWNHFKYSQHIIIQRI